MNNNMTNEIGKPLYMYDVVTSTFDKAAEFEPMHGLTVVAKQQTAGRGRLGRQWESGIGGLYMSIYLATDATIEKCGLITSLCAVAVANAISQYGDCRIKWPNDIVLNGKKICGILTKSCIQDGKANYACVGIGINTNRQDFAPELANASSILLQTQQHCDENQLLKDVLHQIQQAYNCSPAQIMEQYKEKCITLGSEVTVHYADGSDKISGICTDISPNGELVVQSNGQAITVSAGEVSV
ncbi:MAG: biotin--[Clostridia bacterium]|nr:biotin--[acetyl-CoA-carboxylase] ligase [Clostridia bacterium]